MMNNFIISKVQLGCRPLTKVRNALGVSMSKCVGAQHFVILNRKLAKNFHFWSYYCSLCIARPFRWSFSWSVCFLACSSLPFSAVSWAASCTAHRKASFPLMLVTIPYTSKTTEGANPAVVACETSAAEVQILLTINKLPLIAVPFSLKSSLWNSNFQKILFKLPS